MPVDNDDDDLFDDDDDFLDEATLNALDEVDAKIQAERLKRQQCDSSQDAVPPPAKRPRLDYQQPVSARLEAIDNFPEIVVSGNGRYGIPKGEIVLSFSQASSQSPSQPEQQQQQPPEPPKRTTPPEPPKHSYKPPSKPSPAPQQTRRPAPPLKSTRPPVTVVQTTRQRTPTPPPAPPKVSPQEQELKDRIAKLEDDLKAAKNEGFAKTGEVTILRTNMEKAKKEHAQKIADLISKCHEGNAELAQARREMKEERERMQTQLAFKNQEQEALRRQRVQATPIRETPQPQAGPSRIISPVATRRLPEKRSQRLPGFKNAFTQSPTFQKNKRGKDRATQQLEPPSSPPCSPPKFITEDVEMDDVFVDTADPPQGQAFSSQMEEFPIESDLDPNVIDLGSYDWKAEMYQIILTHKHPSSSRNTLQYLLEAQVPREHEEDYRYSIDQLLTVLGSHQALHDYYSAASAIASSLINITTMLITHNIIPQLLTMLHLFVQLIYSLPSFTSILLAQKQGTNSRILVAICAFIPRHIAPPKQKNRDEAYPTELAHTTMDFLCALCWNPARKEADQLLYMFRNREVFDTLLQGCQPTWMLQRVTEFVTMQLSCPRVASSLLSISATEPPTIDNAKFPVLDRLCSFLVDSNRHNSEGMPLKRSILCFVGLLSASHPDALPLLAASQILVPTLVAFLTMLITPLWQDEDEFVYSPDLTKSTVRLLNQTMYLLHRLVYHQGSPINLRSKLIRAPVRHFNGILHMFTLTFGRLCYSAVPDWMPDSVGTEMGVISEFASDLLELVVDGPDGDKVWEAFQENGEGERDEEPEEAELLRGSPEI